MRDASPEHQAETALHWFQINYEPFVNDGRWLGFGSGYPGFGHGAWAPPTWVSREILRDEFDGIISDAVIAGLAAVLQGRSEFWTLKRDQPQTLPSLTTDIPATEKTAQVEQALDRLQRALKQFSEHRGIGDNRGPVLDDGEPANVQQAIDLARTGVKSGEKSAVSKARDILLSALGMLGIGLLREFDSQIEKEIWTPAEQIAIHYFHSLHEAAFALSHWLTGFM